mmetsp:Transcript_42571/g.65293  ORF Transcript_42571/g.65293 Transcript_42571/m.65293 type:complete len:117 (-) Transcript_42571:3317-3667(-)
MTNILKDDPGKIDDEADQKVLNNPFNIEDRIDLLMKTFTQEVFKKIIMSVFEKDRRVVTYMIIFRIMQAENFLDPALYDFLISGPKTVNPHASVPDELKGSAWLNNMMWADLKYLS